jgi:glutaredoxin
MSQSTEVKYLIHVQDDCPWCVRAKALLDHYQAKYDTETSKCEEWPTWPAIYRLQGSSKELIGGYDQLITFSYENGL